MLNRASKGATGQWNGDDNILPLQQGHDQSSEVFYQPWLLLYPHCVCVWASTLRLHNGPYFMNVYSWRLPTTPE